MKINISCKLYTVTVNFIIYGVRLSMDNKYTHLCLLFQSWYSLEGSPEIGAQVWSDLGYLNCLRHLFRWTTDLKLFEEKTFFSSCIATSPGYQLPQIPWFE